MAIFFRLLAQDDTATVLAAVTSALHNGAYESLMFSIEPSSFEKVPGAPFAYWASPRTLRTFELYPKLQSAGRTAVSGGKTLDDFRFIRAAWEVAPSQGEGWPGFAKGGAFSPYYADVFLNLYWQNDARALKAYLVEYRETRGWSPNWTAELHGSEYYLRPGLTWPRRTNGLSFRALPQGCIFADKGPAAFVKNDDPQELLALSALVNSRPFGGLVSLQLARTELAQSFEVGLIQQTPVPNTDQVEKEHLAALAHRAWSIKRDLDTAAQSSHAFLLPALLQAVGSNLTDRAAAWSIFVVDTHRKLVRIQSEIDNLAFELYGIDGADRTAMETANHPASSDGLAGDAAEVDESDSEAGENEEEPGTDVAVLTTALVSWAVGVAFGRFDVRLATGERQPPREPDPFDRLPRCSPGMLTGADGLPLEAPPPGYLTAFPRDGILADDPGDQADLTSRVSAVFDCIFGADADRFRTEAAQILGTGAGDLRPWLCRSLFEDTIRRYSRSRRKAPIYWQLATRSASYSAWVYYQRLTNDTFYTVLSDHVGPKLQHEERRLGTLLAEGENSPNAGQRRQIAEQEAFVEELRAFREEVARIAPLWNPNHDDGVIINFAPLWRLVPQHRVWQRECKECWDKLVAGQYDWSHLAMHLWPERVVPKCADDRSLAIAHELEEVFWFEDADSKWKSREVPARPVDELVRERTSPAVKAALKSLLEAPPANGGSRRGRRRTSR
jgi:hypothetical protein